MSASGRNLPTSFSDALKLARELLSSRHELIRKGVIETEAEQIVLSAYRQTQGSKLNRLELYSRPRDRYPDEAGSRLIILAMARAEGKLLQHLTGVQAFLGHEYRVGPGVLIPRPETELLAVEAIATLKRFSAPPQLGLEIGVGSGVLSIELLKAFPSLTVFASELTDEARGYAYDNAETILGPADASKRFRLLKTLKASMVFEPFETGVVSGSLDFIISNPPYLESGDPIDDEVKTHEPWAALFAPLGDAIYFYRKIEEKARELLKPGGFVFLEVPQERGKMILQLFPASYWTSRLVHDLNLRDRVIIAQKVE